MNSFLSRCRSNKRANLLIFSVFGGGISTMRTLPLVSLPFAAYLHFVA